MLNDSMSELTAMTPTPSVLAFISKRCHTSNSTTTHIAELAVSLPLTVGSVTEKSKTARVIGKICNHSTAFGTFDNAASLFNKRNCKIHAITGKNNNVNKIIADIGALVSELSAMCFTFS